MEGTEAVKEVKKFIKRAVCPTCGRKSVDLVITTVPKQALQQFLEFADSDEFGGHRGFALKFLLDSYLGRITDGVLELSQEVELLSEKFAELDTQPEEKKVTCNVAGKELKIGG